MRREPFLILLLTTTTLVWGSAFTAIKTVVAVLSPGDLAFVRFAISAVLFALVLWRLHLRGVELPLLTLRQWGLVGLLGFFGVVGYHVSLNGGEALLTRTASQDVVAVLSAFLISLNPLMTLLLSPFFVREPIGGRRALGVLVALGGAVILILWGRGTLIEPDALAGVLVVLVAPLSWALYTLLMKRLLPGFDSMAMTCYAMIAGTFLLLPFVSPTLPESLPRLSLAHWGWILLLSIGATFGGYLAWNLALSHWDAARVSSFVYLVPLFGILVARLQAHELITPQILVGGGLVLGGVWLANTRVALTGGPRASTAPTAAESPKK